jgi:D-3-phosphoglycerate dehydrogenase
MRILVVGDGYCPSSELAPAFALLEREHRLDFVDVVDDPSWQPTTVSESTLKEWMGTPAQVIDHLDGHDALVVQGAPVSAEVMDADPQLRLICCARGGPVNVDLAAAAERGIPVVTTPGKNADAVAELTIAFMVMVARRMPEAIRHVESNAEFGHDNYEGAHWFGHDLAGKTLGIVGFGQIGRRVAARARAFNMDVVAFDPLLPADSVAADGVEPVDLATLLGRADFVSLHARLTSSNRGLIGAAEVRAMRPGSYLINTARHELIDESAVIEGLASGRLAGAAFDIATASPHSGRHPLLAHPNVVIVPHIGGATYETLHHGGEMAAAEIARLLRGEPLLNVANRAALEARASQAVGAR